ncbi:hypothetical protein ZIOFF_029455 [Zingiber officinale]|uniref:Uncharacterized protein n=1 Tax=Zingiber officinale TaxID=94328 RepID=A0A8J5GRK9_ZINOF|nr:hypothetical protein ZIOFF_029455 [Zingiber officinale]
MAETKMVVVAFLLVAMLVASSASAAQATCFLNCYARCANGKVGDTSCNNMCMQACVIPTSISTDGSVNFDPSSIMAETKMVVVAFLLVAMLVASSAPAVEGAHCLRDCFARCPKETDNTVTSCHDLCVQSCIIPRRKR